MAGTVSSQLTTITLAEAGDSGNWDDIGGGPGSGQTSDSPIQGTEARGRRIDNSVRGFSYDNTTPINLSAAGVHVGFWVLVYQPAQILTNGIELIVGDAATPKSGNWGGHFFDVTKYPAVGGWVRAFVHLARTPDTSGGTYALTALRQFGCEFEMGNVGGTSLNCQLDRIDYTTSGLLINAGTVGSPAVFSNFVTFDSGTDTNRQGVVIPRNGVIFVNARLTIGNATATVFNDTGFALVFADQTLCSTTFMGLTIDLQNASTDVTLANGLIRSGGTDRLGDFLVSGTSGDLSVSGVSFDKIRAFTLNSKCTLDGCSINSSGNITGTTAFTITNGTISNSTAASAVTWNIASDPSAFLNNLDFRSSGTGHALELGTSSPTTLTFSSLNFSGYASTNGSTGNEAIWIRRTSGTVTINITGGGTIPTYRTDGATVVINSSYTLTLTGLLSGSQVTIMQDYETSPTEIFYTGSVSGLGTVAYTYGYSSDIDSTILIASLTGENYDIDVTLSNSNQTLPISQNIDRVYKNPT